jgi:ATP-binding cassette subfamily B protein
MVEKSFAFSQDQLGQYFAQFFGDALSELELSNCFNHSEIEKPSAGKRFWQTADAIVGIYIVLVGKIRLLDSSDNLIASVETGATFGELTLFPEEQFQPYAIRASVNLQICFIPGHILRSLFKNHPAIREHLYNRAIERDLLLLCRQVTPLNQAPVEGLMKTLPLFEWHDLKVGKVSASLLKNRQLFLIRQGEIQHSSGQTLTSGTLYTSCPN